MDEAEYMAQVLRKSGDAHSEQARRLGALAEASRTWALAFNRAGGGVSALSRDLPLSFAVEFLARARLHDTIALACDGAELGLCAHARRKLEAEVSTGVADLAWQELARATEADREQQASLRR